MDINQVINGILSVRGRIEQNFQSPDALSDLATKLASYNAHLGDYVGEMEQELGRETTKRHYQYTVEGDLSDSAAEKKIKAELAERTAEKKKLKIMHKDASTQISTIQSRLRVLGDERRNG